MKRPPEPRSVSEYRCRDKIRHPSERIAQQRADIKAQEIGLPLRVYRCPHCKAWHWTKQAEGHKPIKRRVLIFREPDLV
jgi:hypothetical protein